MNLHLLVYKIRIFSTSRAAWVLAICACLGLLLYAFITQLRVYLGFPVKTSIVIEKVQSITFPTITICNYNQFRKSIVSQDPEMAAKLCDLFPVVVPKAEGLFPNSRGHRSGIDVNLTQRLMSLAHQREDLFLHCYWLGREVPCSDYVDMRMTEAGVCYSFNSPRSQVKNGPLVVHGSGADHGLLLRLNIQQAEYYFGEGTSAGIKVTIFLRPYYHCGISLSLFNRRPENRI